MLESSSTLRKSQLKSPIDNCFSALFLDFLSVMSEIYDVTKSILQLYTAKFVFDASYSSEKSIKKF